MTCHRCPLSSIIMRFRRVPVATNLPNSEGYRLLRSIQVNVFCTGTQAAYLLRSWVRIPPVAWIFVCCECRVLSGRGLCDELITRPEESYLLCCVVVSDLETSRMGAPYIYDISRLKVNNLTLIPLTWRKW